MPFARAAKRPFEKRNVDVFVVHSLSVNSNTKLKHETLCSVCARAGHIVDSVVGSIVNRRTNTHFLNDHHSNLFIFSLDIFAFPVSSNVSINE